MQPLEICGLCEYYYELSEECAYHNIPINRMMTGCRHFNHVTHISVDMFAYLVQLVPPETSIPELCELLGIKYGDDTDA